MTPFYARPVGLIQWVCPDCAYIHGSAKANWRSGRLTCSHCRHVFAAGVGFADTTLVPLPPFNALFLGSWRGPYANLAGPYPATLKMAIGRIVGSVQWSCPSCHNSFLYGQSIEWVTGQLTCPSCSLTGYIYLILHRPIRGCKASPPRDWVLSGQYAIDESIRHPAHAPSGSESIGAYG